MGLKGYKHTLEAKEKIALRTRGLTYEQIYGDQAEAQKLNRGLPKRGRRLSLAHRQALSSARKGKIPWNKGMTGVQVAWNKGKPSTWAVGEKNHNWKGGITPLNRQLRTSLEYKIWRRKVFERDFFACVVCKAKSGHTEDDGTKVVLHADHIKPFSLYPDLRFEVSNGRTLCKPCHKELGWELFREANPRSK